jgi:hypothetical protein
MALDILLRVWILLIDVIVIKKLKHIKIGVKNAIIRSK